MSLQLEIVSDHRDLVGDDAVRVFDDTGGTIGRSLQSDWILPDPRRYISGRHAIIDYQGGAYYLADTSSNGVYMNGDCEPIGKGNPRRLFSGDVIKLGDFVINVTIDEGESLTLPAARPERVATDHAHSRVEDELAKSSMLLLEEEALTGDDEFQSALFGRRDDPHEGQAAENDPMPPQAAAAAEAAPEAPRQAPNELIEAFLAGLGLDGQVLHPDAEPREVLRNAGEVLREFVEGTTLLLASRASTKTTLQLDETTVLPRHNNPLKLAQNSDDLLRQLLVGKEGEFLGSRDAVREVCRDLLFYQDAFIGAMDSACLDLTGQFEPEELQQAFDRELGDGLIARLLGKLRYWDMYAALYPRLTEKGGGKVPQSFSEEFVRAFEQSIAERKRLGNSADSRGETDIPSTPARRPVSKPQPVAEQQPDAELSAELDAINASPFALDDLVEFEPDDTGEAR